MAVTTICGFCKAVASVTHTLVRFPTGLFADCFTCAGCGAIVSISRAPIEQSKIVKPSSGQIEKLTQN